MNSTKQVSAGFLRRKKILLALAVLLLLLFPLGGWRLVQVGLARLTLQFETLESDDRILYEPGSEELANLANSCLKQSLEEAQRFHHLEFQNPVKVFVFADMNHYCSYANVRGGRGAAIVKEVYLSPNLLEMPDTTHAILAHELSHCLLKQHMGGLHFQRSLPTWFREGLATLASHGGGAEGNTREDAISAILSGRSFHPEPSGGLFFSKSASSYGLKPRMFYKQSSLFVEYIRNRDKAAFENLLVSLRDNEFKDLVMSNYSATLEDLWTDFIQSISEEDGES